MANRSSCASVLVDLLSPESPGGSAYVLVKQTYALADGNCHPAEPEPLLHDFREREPGAPLLPDTDCWPRKDFTDVVVQGLAYCTAAATHREISVDVAGSIKRIQVVGPRTVRFDGAGRQTIEGPERFHEMPLVYGNAYGGCDWTVQPDDPEDPALPFILESDHPGLYPRNPFGKGYLVHDTGGREVELPNLEDPEDLLTPERLATGDPGLWYRQPLPWCFDWLPIAAFPRYAMMISEADAWYPGPEDESLPEVARGILPAGYRSRMRQRATTEGPDPRFFQGGALGMTFRSLGPGAPIQMEGMHPDLERIRLTLPTPPAISMAVDGDWRGVQPRLHHVVIRPADLKMNLVYGAERELPRPFIPGVHKNIPVAASVDGAEPINYEAPPTVDEQLLQARAEASRQAGEHEEQE